MPMAEWVDWLAPRKNRPRWEELCHKMGLGTTPCKKTAVRALFDAYKATTMGRGAVLRPPQQA
eukprot:1222806-Alexandrium_andersonii.AAC.1